MGSNHQKKLKKLNRINRRKKILSVSKDVFLNFIFQSLEDKSKENKQVNIGITTEDSQKRIEELIGKRISNIDINKSGIIHTVTKKAHNIKPEDMLHAVDAINEADSMSLSDDKHQDCDVLVFKKDIKGEITFLAEAHIQNNYLLIFNGWRKMAERSTDATLTSPPGLTSETNLSQAVNNNIAQNPHLVNGKKV
jgi:hypothetical protein